MILPGSYAVVLTVLILGMLGWGLWANTLKATGGKWRFELYYFDFAIGVLLAATVLALTFGSLGFDGFSFADDLRLAGKRQDFFGFVGGLVFNLGNMLLVAAVSIAGMVVAFPVGMGFALIVAGFWNHALNPGGRLAFVLVGAVVVLGAIVFDILAFRRWSASKLNSQVEPSSGKPASGKNKPKRKPNVKGVILSLAGGLLLGSFPPLVQLGMESEVGLGPYSMGFVFAAGVLFSTFVYNLFFMNLPVQGEPVDIAEYIRAKVSRHAVGILGGILWYTGMIAGLIARRTEGAAQVSPRLIYSMAQASILIAGLCGFFLWREWEGADGLVKVRYGLMLVFLVVGIGLSAAGLAPPQ